MRNKPCTTRMMMAATASSSYAIALPVNSPITEQFNDVIIELRDNGKLDSLLSQWIDGPCLSTERRECLFS